MDLLSEKQIDQINDSLVKHGVGYDNLRYDLLDHICCMVEEGMERGQHFSVSLENSFEAFGIENLKLIQESTLYLLNQKLNKMKKVTSVTGLLSSLMVIVGIVFKLNHLLGAGLFLTLGVSLGALVTIPLMAYMAIVAKEDRHPVLASLLGYFAAITMSMGGMFKIMHWPYATILFWLGLGVILLGFMPLYTIRSYRLAENKIFALTKSAMIIAGAALLWSLSANNPVFNVKVADGNPTENSRH